MVRQGRKKWLLAAMAVFLVASLLGGSVSTATVGGVTDLANESAFSPGATLITFDPGEGRTVAEHINTQYQTLGVTFVDDDKTTPLIVNAYNRGDAPTKSEPFSLFNDADTPNTSANLPLSMLFNPPVQKVGMYIGNGQAAAAVTAKLQAYDGAGNLIGEVARTGFGKDVLTFIGLDAGAPAIASAKLDYGNTLLGEEIDNLLFEGKQAQRVDSFFDIFVEVALSQPPDQAVKQLPKLLTEIFPQGLVTLADPGDRRTQEANGRWRQDVGTVMGVVKGIGTNPNASDQTRQIALGVGQFLQQMVTLTEQLNPMIANEAIYQVAKQSEKDPNFWSYQVKNPNIIEILTLTPAPPYSNMAPTIRWHPGVPEEEIITPKEAIPMWGAWVITKEVKGMKLRVIKGPVPVNPCRYHIPPPWPTYPYYLWQLQLVPAEFIKSIMYTNTFNFETRQPELKINVDTREVLESQLLDFWWFLPKAQQSSSY